MLARRYNRRGAFVPAVAESCLSRVKVMNHGLAIRDSASVDFVWLGTLVHRLDSGIVPFRKAHECQIHVSGGEFNVAANLSDCSVCGPALLPQWSSILIGDLEIGRAHV